MDQVLRRLCASSGARNYQRDIRQYLWSHRSEKETDLAIISGDECLELHRAIILPLSDHLKELLPPSCPCSKPSICLPPFPSPVLAAAFELLYTGSTNIDAFQKDDVQVKEVFALLKIKVDVDEDKHIGGERSTGAMAGGGIRKIESNDEDPLAGLENGEQITPPGQEIHGCYLNEATGVFYYDKNVSGLNESENSKNHDQPFSYSFYKAIQSQGKKDQNDNKIIPQNGEQIIPLHQGIHNCCLSEVTGLFYNDDNDVKTVLLNKNPSVLKRNVNENEIMAGNSDDLPKDEWNKLEKVFSTTSDNIDEITQKEKYEKDKKVGNVNESLKNGEHDLSRCPKRRYLTKMNYFGIEEEQLSSSFQAPNLKTKKRKGKESDDVVRETDCNFLLPETKSQCGNKAMMTGLDGNILSSMSISHPSNKNEQMTGLDNNFPSTKSKPQPANKKQKKATDQTPSKFTCNTCDYTTKRKDVLKRHMNGMHQKISFNCDQCDYTTTWTANLERHVDAVHKKISYNCDQCDFTTTWRENVQKHIDGVHKEISYNCDQCDYTTPWKGNLKNHIDGVHVKISYDCHKCDFTTMWKETLKKHIHGAHQNTYNCDQCDFGTTWKSSLQRHIDGAHKKISFKCDQCDYETAWKEGLKKHIEGAHENIFYKCDQCGYETVWKQNLKKHNDSVHLKNSYKCDQCDFTTTWKESLLKHTDGLHTVVSRSLYKSCSKADTKATVTSHKSVHGNGSGNGQVKFQKMSAAVIPNPVSDNLGLAGKGIKTEKV